MDEIRATLIVRAHRWYEVGAIVNLSVGANLITSVAASPSSSRHSVQLVLSGSTFMVAGVFFMFCTWWVSTWREMHEGRTSDVIAYLVREAGEGSRVLRALTGGCTSCALGIYLVVRSLF